METGKRGSQTRSLGKEKSNNSSFYTEIPQYWCKEDSLCCSIKHSGSSDYVQNCKHTTQLKNTAALSWCAVLGSFRRMVFLKHPSKILPNRNISLNSATLKNKSVEDV